MPIAEQIPYFTELPKSMQVFLINLMAFLVALILVWFVRIMVRRLIMRPVRGLVGRTSMKHDDRILTAVERPIRIVVLGVGIWLASLIFQFSVQADEFAVNLSQALIISGMIFFVYNLIDIIAFTPTSLQRITGITLEERLLPFMRTVVKVFIVVMGLFIVLQTFEYDVTGLIASFGVIGLAFALAAQDTAANVFGFTAIVSDNPFQIGDYIVTEKFAGTVEHVGVRSTQVRKLDQSLVYVPNSQLTDSEITNWSRLSRRRLDFYVGLTYETNSDAMREFTTRVRDMLMQRESVDEETVIVHFVNFSDSSLDVRVIAYVKISDWALFTSEQEQINLEIMEIVESMGLSIAFPSQSLYVMPTPDKPSSSSAQQPIKRPDTRPRGTIPGIFEADNDDDTKAQFEGKAEDNFQANESASNDGDADGR